MLDARAAAAETTDAVASWMLSGIAILDDYGAQTWNLRLVGLITMLCLWSIRMTFGKKRGVDWYALLHALISGFGSIAVVYLDMFAAEQIAGTPEPLRSVRCEGPLTSLHHVLPAVTMGYAIFDLLDGLTIGLDFMLHGAATLAVMAFFVEHGASNLIAPMLLMEVSTIFLTVVRADFFSPLVTLIDQLLFAVTFFLFRVVLCPYIWSILVKVMWAERNMPEYQSCHQPYILPIVLLFGFFFHSLNAFWFYKIVRKVQRKLSGREKIHEGNDLADKSHHKVE